MYPSVTYKQDGHHIDDAANEPAAPLFVQGCGRLTDDCWWIEERDDCRHSHVYCLRIPLLLLLAMPFFCCYLEEDSWGTCITIPVILTLHGLSVHLVESTVAPGTSVFYVSGGMVVNVLICPA